jgi:hypothetical protein
MTSELKCITARLNGAKSRGPKTAAGLEKSSRNAWKYDLRSGKWMVLDSGNHHEFQRILDGFVAIYQPATPEKNQVDRMALAEWRIRRLSAIQSSLLSAEILRQESIDRDAHPDLAVGRVFRALAEESNSPKPSAISNRNGFLPTTNYRTNLPALKTIELAGRQNLRTQIPTRKPPAKRLQAKMVGRHKAGSHSKTPIDR